MMSVLRTRASSVTAAAASVCFVGSLQAAPFVPNSIAVYRVGTSGGSLNTAAAPVSVDFYSANGSLANTIALPTTASGTNRALVAQGSASNEGMMTLSGDGKYYVLGGYDVAVGTSSPSGTTPAISGSTVTNGRVIGLVNVTTGAVDTSNVYGDVAGAVRSAYSLDGTAFWMGGASASPRYGSAGSNTTTQISGGTTPVTNIRYLTAADFGSGNQLVVGHGSGTVWTRPATLGSGMPTTASQYADIPGLLKQTGTSPNLIVPAPNQLLFLDLSSTVAGVDTLYYADDAANFAGVNKFSLVGGTWVSNGIIGSGTQVRGLTGYVDPSGTVNLFTSSASTLYGALDAGGYNAAVSGSLSSLATAPTGTAFRGLVWVPEPASLATLGVIGLVALRRRGR